jgi:chaperonin GroEL
MSHVFNEITYTDSATTRELVDEVLSAAYEAVCSTAGPEGQYVVINELDSPNVTKDGVSVAKAIDFNEPRRNLIAKIIMEPAIKTDVEVGDGTTTTVMMMSALYQQFKDKLSFRNTRFLDMLVEETRQILSDLVIPGDVHSETFYRMLLTTANYEEDIVDEVIKIYRQFDKPNITLELTPALPKDVIETNSLVYVLGSYATDEFRPSSNVEGLKFMGNEGTRWRAIVIDGHFNAVDASSLTKLMADGDAMYSGDIVIFATNFEQSVIAIIKNYIQRYQVKITPYRINAGGSLASNILKDLADILGTQTVTEFTHIQEEHLVDIQVKSILTQNAVTFNPAESETVRDICKGIVDNLTPRYEAMTVLDRQKPIGRNLLDRISRLSGTNVVIKVTGEVPSDATERRDRFEDVIKAARTGRIYGVLPGIGWGYLEAGRQLLRMVRPQNEWQEELLKEYLHVLTQPYTQLTGVDYIITDDGTPMFLDLVTGHSSSEVTAVFDNAAATMTALSAGWSTAKTLAKLHNICGRSMKSYKNR